jgi:hypothetical protein
MLERIELAADRGFEYRLDTMVPRDDGGILPAHVRRLGGRLDYFAGETMAPALQPSIAGRGVAELRPDSVILAFGRITQGAETIGEIGTCVGYGL